MTRRYAVPAVLAGAALAVGAAQAVPAKAASAGRPANVVNGPPSSPFAPGSGKPIVDWNKTLIAILSTPGAQPATIHPTRSLAILQAAEYDAVVSVTRVGRPYLFRVRVHGPASAAAAADQAAHDVLTGLYPAQASVADSQLATQLSAIPDGRAKARGVATGHAVADRLLAIRSADGSALIPPPFVPGTKPGDYQPTPPNMTPRSSTTGAISPRSC